MRRLAALIALAALSLPGPLGAQEGTGMSPIVRQSVEPATGAVIGQHIALYVDVLFRDAMPRPPRVRLPDVAGIQVFRFETQGTTINDTIDGADYVGQRFEFAIYPRRAGEILVPPAVVTIVDQQGTPAGSVQGTEVNLGITAPAGVDPSQPVVATQHLTMNEQWTPALDRKFKAGDAVVRIVTREVDDVPSLAMLDLDASAPDGVRVYAEPPDTQDHVERGVLTGKRVDRITYVFSRGGRFDLPAMSQPWWNLAEGTLENATVPAATLTVASAPATFSNDAGHGSMVTRHLPEIGGALVIAILTAGAYGIWRLRRGRPRSAEADAFAALRKACETEDVGNIYRLFVAWRRTLAPDQSKRAYELAGRLYGVLFTRSQQPWTRSDSQSLIKYLHEMPRPQASTKHVDVLPPLNPLHS